MRPPLLPLALALLTASSSLGDKEGSQVTTEAGSPVTLTCNLPGPRLIWTWLPRSPRCAGVSGGITTIYTATAAGAEHVPLQRFQTRLRLRTGPGTRPSVLDLRPTHVSDSGVFSCASPSQAGPNVSVTITPGCQGGASIHATPDEPPRAGASVSLSCLPCEAQGPTASTARGPIWLLNGEPPPDSAALRVLRDKVTIENFSSRFEGFWSCRLLGDPPRTGSYCLEREPGAPGTKESPSPSPTQSGTPEPWTDPLLSALWGCVGVALVLILTGALAFVCWRRRQSRNVSETCPVPTAKGEQEPAAARPGPLEPAGAERSPPAPDPQPAGEGPDGIQYSTLRFQETGGAAGGGETDPPTIYAQLAPGPGGRG